MDTIIDDIKPYIKNNNNTLSSKTDTAEYTYITLANGLTIFFIDDNISLNESALMYVNVGSKDNPEDALGIAHFLEHMLFMGSDLYKGPSLFQTELANNGGETNAFTSDTSTQYYFTSPINFMHILKMFSRFFIKPLFDVNYVEKEVGAVDSEHKKNISSDMWKVQNIIPKLYKEKNLHKFSTGTKKTLLPNNDPKQLRDKLIRFYTKHYSAHKMVLYISKHKTNNYKDEIIKMFEEVPNNNNVSELYTASYKEYVDKFEIIKLQTINNNNYLSIFWVLKNIYNEYYNNSYDILSYILNNIDCGLHNILKNKGYCDDIYASVSNHFDDCCLFEIKLELTNKGVSKWEFIIYFMDIYIKYILNNVDSVFDMFYDEYKKLTLLYFQTASKLEGIELSLYYADVRDKYKLDFSLLPINTIIHGEINKCKKHFIECLKNMTLSKLKCILYSPLVKNKTTNKVDIYYNTKYKRNKTSIKYDLYNKLNTMFNDINLPKKNQYIIHDILSIIEPINTDDNSYARLYSKLNNIYYMKKKNTFNTSSIYAKINIVIDALCDNINKYDVLIHIYILFIYVDKLNEILFTKLNTAKISVDFNIFDDNIMITLNGYNCTHKIDNIFNMVVNKYYMVVDIDTDIYEYAYNKISNNLYDYLHANVYTMIKPEFCCMLNNTKLNKIKLIEVMKKYSPKKMDNNYKKFFNDAIKYISYGNIIGIFGGSMQVSCATSIIQILETKINKSIIENNIVNIKTSVKNTIINKNKYNTEKAIGYGLYVGNIKEPYDNWEYTYLLCDLLNMFISNHFSNIIRTEKQIGYIARSEIINVNTLDNPYKYIMFVVQSTVDNLFEIVDEYINKTFLSAVKTITNKEFDIMKNSLMILLNENPINIYDEVDNTLTALRSTYNIYNSCSIDKNFDKYIIDRFNRKKILANKLLVIELADLKSFSKIVYNNPRSVINITPVNPNKTN